MKTTLNDLMDYLHLEEDYEQMNENLQVHDIVYKVAELLKTEKEQIIRAYEISAVNHSYSGGGTTGEDYFNQTYISNS